MEIYNDLSNPASQEFEKLLNSQLSKIQIEEGKIIEGKINKITEKFEPNQTEMPRELIGENSVMYFSIAAPAK